MPVFQQLRILADLKEQTSQNDRVQDQIGNGNQGSEPDGFPEPGQKDQRQQKQQRDGDRDASFTGKRVKVGIFDRVLSRIGSRQSHSDNKVGRRKAKQNQYQKTAPPALEQVLEHGYRSLARVRTPGDLSVYGQSAE